MFILRILFIILGLVMQLINNIDLKLCVSHYTGQIFHYLCLNTSLNNRLKEKPQCLLQNNKEK